MLHIQYYICRYTYVMLLYYTMCTNMLTTVVRGQ